MGIEDLNLNLSEYSERIAIVSESPDTTRIASEILRLRNYKCHSFSCLEAANEWADDEIVDLVLFEPTTNQLDLTAIRLHLRSFTRLLHSCVLIAHNSIGKDFQHKLIPEAPELNVVSIPLDPKMLIVRVATLLRLRRLKAQEMRFESDIASQNALLRDLTTRFKRELSSAQAIQKSLLPTSLPQHDKCHFAATYVPLEAVGGDLFDIWSNSTNNFGFFIGDVTGHGLGAAFIGAMTKMAISYAPKTKPQEMLQHIAKGLTPHMPEGNFVTALAAIVDLERRALSVARGGHPPMFLWRQQEKEIKTVAPRGFPLGILEDAVYEVETIVMGPGDKFLLITDGLAETMNMQGQMLGSEGVEKAFADVASTHNISDCLKHILQFQREFSNGRSLKDDLTLLGFELVA